MKTKIFLVLVCLAGTLKAQFTPGFPKYQLQRVVPDSALAGTLMISSEINGELKLDGQHVAILSPWHWTTIFENPNKPHNLVFKSGDVTRETRLEAGTKNVVYLRLKADTALIDSVLRGKNTIGIERKIVTKYLPFKKAISIQLSGGLTFNKSGSAFLGKLIIGYSFSPKLMVGIGSGWVNNLTRLKKYVAISPMNDKPTYNSSSFNLSYIPVFAAFSYRLLDKKISPFFSIGMGASFPLTNSASGQGIQDEDYHQSYEYFQVDKINTGAYMDLSAGVKIFVTNFLELGAVLGYEASFNTMYIKYASNPSNLPMIHANKTLHVTNGLHADLIIDFHSIIRQTPKLPVGN